MTKTIEVIARCEIEVRFPLEVEPMDDTRAAIEEYLGCLWEPKVYTSRAYYPQPVCERISDWEIREP